MPEPSADRIEVVAPNLKRRLSGVTATVVRLDLVQARMIGIGCHRPRPAAGTAPYRAGPRRHAAARPLGAARHARRNTEMALGLILRRVLRRRYRLLFTSAAQRAHTGFTRWLIRQQDALIATLPQAAAILSVRRRSSCMASIWAFFTPPRTAPPCAPSWAFSPRIS